jgi:hypothetical protein
MAIELDHMEITPWGDSGAFKVHPVWKGVDRPDTGGTVVTSRKLAERLAAAIRTGATDIPERIGTDVNGKTYVITRSMVRSRALNADLRRLGF